MSSRPSYRWLFAGYHDGLATSGVSVVPSAVEICKQECPHAPVAKYLPLFVWFGSVMNAGETGPSLAGCDGAATSGQKATKDVLSMWLLTS